MLTIAYQGWCYGRRCDFRASCLVEICSVKLLNAMKSLHGQLPRLSQPLRFMCNDGNDAPPEIVQNHFQSEFRRRAEAFFVAVFFASNRSFVWELQVLGSADVVKQFHHLWPQEVREHVFQSLFVHDFAVVAFWPASMKRQFCWKYLVRLRPPFLSTLLGS